MKLWVDDERPAPEGWVAVKSSAAAVEKLETENVVEMSLDYSLGNWDSGDEVLYWLRDNKDRIPETIYAHSSSASGRGLLERVGKDLLGVDVIDAG